MRYVYLLRVLIGLLDRLWLCPLWVAIVISSVLVLKLRPNDRNISQHKISQHRWLSICKLRPNGRKHIATLLAATCCARSATLLRRDAGMLGIENRTSSHAWTHYCCNDLAKRPQHHATFLKVAWKFGHFQISANNTNLSQHVATGLPNTCDMLRPLMLWYVVLNVVIVWPGGA